jgi:hypothetical protein
MQLPAVHFLERFALHVLPTGFVRIRHYGMLANRRKRTQLERAAAALDIAPAPPPEVESVHAFCLRVLHFDITLCPACHIGRLHFLGSIPPAHPQRAPP